ncbi:MAG: hypothetical protein D3917_01700 [Candidatus Electrothrix sp. AX5]|nr:hypothetical protein [Candidatus Electrothrix sp. AX5]
MKKNQSLLICSVLVAVMAVASAGTAEAAWSSYMKINKIVTYSFYSWVYAQDRTNTTMGSTYYYCRIYNPDLLNQAQIALANNTTVKLGCVSTWDTDSSRICKDYTGPNYYECNSMQSFRNE